MKTASAALALAVTLVPAVAWACPAAANACGACGSSFGSYLAALGVGLLVGMGSVRFEGLFRRK
jgi:hypothetical protein